MQDLPPPSQENAMTTPVLAPRPLAATLAAAALATLVSFGTLGAVAGLFASYGMPLAEAAAAGQACVHYAFASERERCAQALIAAPRLAQLANR